LQELIRRLRKAGGFANTSCGIHIHLDGAPPHAAQHPQLHEHHRQQK
jgi:hypothetical protein